MRIIILKYSSKLIFVAKNATYLVRAKAAQVYGVVFKLGGFHWRNVGERVVGFFVQLTL